jgi:hypothetical protein
VDRFVAGQHEEAKGIPDAWLDRIAEGRRLFVDDDLNVISLLLHAHDS